MSVFNTHTRPSIYALLRDRSVESIAFEIGRTIQRMNDLARSRRTLRGLDDAQLSDIGVSRRAALLEARQPRWTIPAAWRV